MTLEQKKDRVKELLKQFEIEYLNKKMDLDSVNNLLAAFGKALKIADNIEGEIKIAIIIGDGRPVIVSDLVASFLKAVINDQVPCFRDRLETLENTFSAEIKKLKEGE